MNHVRANAESFPHAGDATPQQTWQALSTNSDAQLIDVRTQPEWAFVGVPNLSSIGKQLHCVSWKFYPTMEVNAGFIDQLSARVPDKSAPLYFLCKTGGRSLDAAIAATAAGYKQCYNVEGGFEGESNEHRQRGLITGWKASKLPWEQV
jgi:rhodanese-related sulfurtransferase